MKRISKYKFYSLLLLSCMLSACGGSSSPEDETITDDTLTTENPAPESIIALINNEIVASPVATDDTDWIEFYAVEYIADLFVYSVVDDNAARQ